MTVLIAGFTRINRWGFVMRTTFTHLFFLCIGLVFVVDAQADDKVSLRYIKEMKAIGLRGLDVDHIIKLAEVDATPKYVREMKSMGMRNFDADDAIKLAKAKVTARYAKAVKINKLRHFDSGDVLKLQKAGVSQAYLGEMRNAGASSLRHFDEKDMIALHKAGVPAQYVKDTRKIGLRHFDADDVIKLHRADLPAQFVQEAKALGSRDANAVIKLAAKTGHTHVVVKTQTRRSSSRSEKRTKIGHIATVVGLMMLVGFVIVTVQKRRNGNVVQTGDDVETRLTHFEHRVNDLQDILLSIDDRLDRRLKRT